MSFQMVEVAHILEIVASVVERIPVNVVANHTSWCLCDVSVHKDEKLSAVSAVFTDGVSAAEGWFNRPAVTG